MLVLAITYLANFIYLYNQKFSKVDTLIKL